jgi:hypothetical protein
MSGQGRGGARHKAKPYIDTGLLFKVLNKHEELVADMKGYEVVSRNSAVDPKALHALLPLVNDLLGLVPSAEVHPGPLRQALYQMIQQKPVLNTSKFKGSVWIQMRAERLGTLLFHVRRLGRGIGDQSLCTNLTGLEYSMVQDTLKKVQLPDDEPQPSDKSKVALKKAQGAATLKKDAATLKKDAATLKKDAATLKKDAATLKKGAKTLKKGAATLKKDVQQSRKLKKTRSDVSVDSFGIPKELASPLKASDASPPRIWNKKRFGQKQSTAREASEDEGHVNLQEAMGFKKPAAALKKAKTASKPLKKDLKSKKPATSSPLKKGKALKKAGREPWVKIRKTMAKKPERAYLVGAHHTLEKVKLIVEVSHKKSVHYSWVIDKIWEALLKDHLTKAEAVRMREELCCQYP